MEVLVLTGEHCEWFGIDDKGKSRDNKSVNGGSVALTGGDRVITCIAGCQETPLLLEL